MYTDHVTSVKKAGTRVQAAVKMAKRLKEGVSRYRLIANALAVAIYDHVDDCIEINQLKRKSPTVWMDPYLRGRSDTTQRNTLAKLEADFIKVSNGGRIYVHPS